MTRSGRFVALEGIDGSGTTTQGRMLVEWLCGGSGVAEDEAPARLTCEPSTGPIGTLLRRILRGEREMAPEAVALLFAADRVDHVTSEIGPLLARGVHVVSDRYVFSSLAYQSIDEDLGWVCAINEKAPDPDLTIYLRVDSETAAERRRDRGGAPELFEERELQRAVAARYDELLGRSSDDGSWRLVGGEWQLERRAAPEPRSNGAVPRTGDVAVLDGAAPAPAIHEQLRKLWASLEAAREEAVDGPVV